MTIENKSIRVHERGTYASRFRAKRVEPTKTEDLGPPLFRSIPRKFFTHLDSRSNRTVYFRRSLTDDFHRFPDAKRCLVLSHNNRNGKAAKQLADTADTDTLISATTVWNKKQAQQNEWDGARRTRRRPLRRKKYTHEYAHARAYFDWLWICPFSESQS